MLTSLKPLANNFFSEIPHCEQAHFQGSSRPAVERQVLEGFECAVFAAIDQDEFAIQFDDSIRSEIGKMFDRNVSQVCEWDGQNQEALRLQNAQYLGKGSLDGRGDMLEHFGGYKEVVLSKMLRSGVGNIEKRIAIIEGVCVSETLSKRLGVPGPICQPDAPNFLDRGRVGKYQTLTE